MSVIKMGRLGFIALLATLVLVIGTAYYHSNKVIGVLGTSVQIFGPAQSGLQEVEQLLAQSGFAFLRFVHSERLRSVDVRDAFDRLAAAEKDLIAGIPAKQIPDVFRDLPARHARAMFYAFLEEEAYEPAGDTAVQLANATQVAIYELRQALLSFDEIVKPSEQIIETKQIFRNLIGTADFQFERYTNRVHATLSEAFAPLNSALKMLDALSEAAFSAFPHVGADGRPDPAHPDMGTLKYVLMRYRAALFTYQDAVENGITGTAMIENRQVAQGALHRAQAVLSHANEDLADHMRDVQENSIAIGQVSQALFLGIALFGALMSLGIAYWVRRAIGRRLASLAEAAEHISAGDLDQHLEAASDDDLGKVAIAFNEMSDKLRRRDLSLKLHIRELDDARQHLYEMNEDLESRVEVRTRQLTRAKEEAEFANRAKSDFLANMSHELRTPLNAIIGYAELLQEEVEDRGDQVLIDDLGKVRNAGKHLLGLISNVLDLSKVEAGMMEVDHQETRLDAVLTEIGDTVRPLVTANGNTFEVSSPATVDVFVTDTQKLRQILLNLLGNAAKFTKNGAVRLEVTETPKGWLNFIVSDTGVGMRADQLDRILKPFTQADTGVSNQYGGTGLGLAITKGFAELMGGRLDVESEPGQGSRFTISLPIRQMDAAGTTRASA